MSATQDRKSVTKPPLLSKREANKFEKLRRIQQAARELFAVRGYDDTTMRDIASRAGVALGTLFLYASNKRDLLFLIANDVMEATVKESERLVSDDNSLIDNFLIICGLHFQTFGAQPELFRLVLRELLFYDTGEQGVRATKNRANLLKLISKIVKNAHSRNEIRLPLEADAIAWVLFSLLQAEIRRWIALEKRELGDGLEHLWSSIALLMNGFSERPISPRPSRTDVRRLMTRLIGAPPMVG